VILESLSHIWNTVVDFHRGNITPTVLVWTVAGLFGTIVTLFNLRDAIKDTDSLVVIPEDTPLSRRLDLLEMSKAAIRQELIRLSKMLTVVGIGVTVALSTPVLSDAQRQALHIPYWTPTGIALTVALLWIVFAIVLQAVMDRRLRKRFYSRGQFMREEMKDDVHDPRDHPWQG